MGGMDHSQFRDLGNWDKADEFSELNFRIRTLIEKAILTITVLINIYK